MLPYLAAAVLVGLTSTERMGEKTPALVVQADAWVGEHLRVEGGWDSADKVATGNGWSARGAADFVTGPLTIGAGYTYRHTGEWTKQVWWARAGIQHGPLWLLGIIAPESPGMEAKVEARLRLKHRWAVIEPRAWVGTHKTAREIGGYSWGLTMLVGIAR